jgi:uncharacterized damage-inducible protein DinB
VSTLSERFLAESSRYLGDVYLPRLERALGRLPEEDLWWTPAAGRLSFATILLHLNGNVGQWILSGIGGRPFERDRDAEFSATDGPGGDRLLRQLSTTVTEARALLAELDEARLAAACEIQGSATDVQSAIYHVVEHFGYHTGQAVWIAKARGA